MRLSLAWHTGHRRPRLVQGASAAALLLLGIASADAAANDDIAFFESQIRPLLVARCYECHSQSSGAHEGGLTLDARAGWQSGGDRGPAVHPGQPDKSLLIRAVRYTSDELQMPPDAKLPAGEIRLLEEWVRRGAPDPREGPSVAARRGIDLERGARHWAFQPIRRPEPPAVGHSAWVRNDIDRFVLAKLEAAGLSPNSEADSRVLCRRVTYDLIGLPPTYDQSARFAADADADAAADAWTRLIDSLLDRQEYGQHWGRYWLDVARYADTTDQSVDGERRIPFAHVYRDYVIDAFNSDKPFRKFVLEQIAADRLPAAEQPDLRALGFLTIGRKFLGNADPENLVIDDRIDVIGRGFLGLTIACARCHDHKFDPIPTADYYSLAGILGSLEQPLDLPEYRRTGDAAAIAEYRQQRSTLLQQHEDYVDACLARATEHFRQFAPEYLQYLVRSSPNHRTVEGFIPLDTPRGILAVGGPTRWEQLIARDDALTNRVFGLWRRLLALPAEGFAQAAALELSRLDSSGEIDHALIVARFRGAAPASMLDVADLYGALLTECLQKDDPACLEIRDLAFGPASPIPPRREEIRRDLLRSLVERQLVERQESVQAGNIREKLTALEAQAPVERAMAVAATRSPVQPHVLFRGDARQVGPAVPRRFLQILAMVDQRDYPDDGRLQLAQAIASDRNPLTARVIVNRVWQKHFGRGLTGAADDFGAMGGPPSHPELLDHLAAWLMEHDWSLKQLHRYILDSATWRQSSLPRPEALQSDAENRLLWRNLPRRLEFEALRDSLLAVGVGLDSRLGGRGEKLTNDFRRRTAYGQTDRFAFDPLARTFDAANPDTSISRRSVTLVPQQALFLMNSPFVEQQAAALRDRVLSGDARTTPDRIRLLYRAALARDPSEDECRLTESFIEDAPLEESSPQAWRELAQALLLSNEFIYID
jgi:hypothetical protein